MQAQAGRAAGMVINPQVAEFNATGNGELTTQPNEADGSGSGRGDKTLAYNESQGASRIC